MALQCTTPSSSPPFFLSRNVNKEKMMKSCPPFASIFLRVSKQKQKPSSMGFLRSPSLATDFSRPGLRASKKEDDGPFDMDEGERRDLRKKIRQVMEMNPDVEEETDPVEKRKKMEKLLSDYPLVVEEDDPDWPEDEEGWGFSLDQFFNKITIKNVKKDDDEDDEGYDRENEIVWQDDNYIRPIKDITSAEWEETVFKDISPLVILVHNRYKRPKENERVRNELEKSVNIIWNCSLPSPRCVAIDAVVECGLVSALGVSVFPQLIFTKSGKILHREADNRTADELSKIMAFFYYGAAKPPCLSTSVDNEEKIPSFSTHKQNHPEIVV